MNILFVVTKPIEYSESSNIRNISLMKGFIELGHRVDIYSFPPNRKSIFYDKHCLDSVKFGHRYVIGIDTSASKSSNPIGVKPIARKIIGRLYRRLFIYDTRYWIVKNSKLEDLVCEYDLMISSSDPKSSHKLAEKIYVNNISKIGKWIQYWGDPFANDITRNRNILLKEAVKREEKRLISKASASVYCSPFTYEEMINTYPEYKNNIRYFPRPVEDRSFSENEKEINYSHLVLGYFGAIYGARNLQPLYEAVKNSNHELHLYDSSSVMKEQKNIKIHERLKREDCREAEDRVDILVCVCNKNGTQIPGKIFDASITNKYILVILDGENADKIRSYFEPYNRFVFCNNNQESIRYVLDNIKKYEYTKKPCDAFSNLTIAKEFVKISK